MKRAAFLQYGTNKVLKQFRPLVRSRLNIEKIICNFSLFFTLGLWIKQSCSNLFLDVFFHTIMELNDQIYVQVKPMFQICIFEFTAFAIVEVILLNVNKEVCAAH